MYSTEENIKEYGPEAPVPISQYKKEFEQIINLYKKFSPKKVLEIGTHYGGTLYHWAQEAQNDCLIVAVDDHHLNKDQYELWEKDNSDIVILQGKSQDEHIFWAAKMFSPFDWIFIDGGHTYEEVKADWENYRHMASPHAIIVFHDILPHPNSDVSKLWREIKDRDYATAEYIEDPTQTGCGLGVVFYDEN